MSTIVDVGRLKVNYSNYAQLIRVIVNT